MPWPFNSSHRAHPSEESEAGMTRPGRRPKAWGPLSVLLPRPSSRSAPAVPLPAPPLSRPRASCRGRVRGARRVCSPGTGEGTATGPSKGHAKGRAWPAGRGSIRGLCATTYRTLPDLPGPWLPAGSPAPPRFLLGVYAAGPAPGQTRRQHRPRPGPAQAQAPPRGRARPLSRCCSGPAPSAAQGSRA